MKIKIKLIGSFRTDRFKEEIRNYPSAPTVRHIVDELGIPDSLLGIVLINDIRAGVDDLLRDGDTLCLLPFIDGG
jgi:hypothetical protein